MTHSKSEWIFKSNIVLSFFLSISSKFRQGNQGPLISPPWWLGLRWLMWSLGAVIIWGSFTHTPGGSSWLETSVLLHAGLSRRLLPVVSLSFFSTWWLSAEWAYWEGARRNHITIYDPASESTRHPLHHFLLVEAITGPTEFKERENTSHPLRGSGEVLKELVGPEILLLRFWKIQSVRRSFVFSIYIWTTHSNVLTVVSSVWGIHAWISLCLYVTISFKYSFQDNEHALPL